MRKSTPVLLGLGGLLVLGSAWLYGAAHAPVLRQVKVADVELQTTTVSLKVPKGDMSELVLGVPGDALLSGTCQVEGGGRRLEFEFSEKTLSECNWLPPPFRGNGHILTWDHERGLYHGRGTLVPEQEFRITVQFQQEQLPAGITLWLCWIQPWMASPKTDAGRRREAESIRLAGPTLRTPLHSP